MDLQSNLIESQKQKGTGRGWKASAASVVAHGLIIATVLFMGASATHKVDAEEKPIRAFITQGAAPPPPPSVRHSRRDRVLAGLPRPASHLGHRRRHHAGTMERRCGAA